MVSYPDSIKKLIDTLTRLPGIGPKAAERIAFYLLRGNNALTEQLIETINTVKREIKTCSQCHNIATSDPCDVCNNPKRDKTIICVVAEPQDVLVIEKTGDYNGAYHILGGTLNPVEHTTPDKLNIKSLIARVTTQQPKIQEVIIATNPDLEGESTAMYLARELKKRYIKTTRLARGLPMGSTIEYADEITIASALKGRQEV